MCAVKPIPDGYHSITPSLVCKNAARAIDFYKEVFQAKEIARMTGPGDSIGHAELQIGDSRLMLSDEFPGMATTPIQKARSLHTSSSIRTMWMRSTTAPSKLGAKSICPSRTSSGATVMPRFATPLATSGDWDNTWKTYHSKKWTGAPKPSWHR